MRQRLWTYVISCVGVGSVSKRGGGYTYRSEAGVLCCYLEDRLVQRISALRCGAVPSDSAPTRVCMDITR